MVLVSSKTFPVSSVPDAVGMLMAQLFTDYENDVQLVVNLEKKSFVNFNTSKMSMPSILMFFPFTGMADINFERSKSLRLLGLTFSTKMKWSDNIESISKSVARKVSSLLWVAHTRQFTDIFVHRKKSWGC